MAVNTNARTNRWLTGDPWRHHDREDEELERVRKGPSCVVYLQRHGYANGDDVRAFGPVLPAAARRVSASVLRARRLSPELKRIPEDLVVRHVLPYLFEDDDDDDDEGIRGGFNQFKRLVKTEECVAEGLSSHPRLLQDGWSQGAVHPAWHKFAFDFGDEYDQVVPIHAIHIINMLWWKLNHNGDDADVMLREVEQQFNLRASGVLETSHLASLLLCTGALSLSAALHGEAPVKGDRQAFRSIFEGAQPLDLKRVEAFIVAKIGWRCLYTAPEHMLTHLFVCGSTYANLTEEDGGLDRAVRNDFWRRCSNVSRMLACHDVIFSFTPTMVAGGVLYHVRKSLLTEETATWSPELERLLAIPTDIIQRVAGMIADLVPDPAEPEWPWAVMYRPGGDSD